MRAQGRALPGVAAPGTLGIVGCLCKAWVVACLVLAACDDGAQIARAPDAPSEVDAEACPLYHALCNPGGDPGAQGCSPGQKCTFVVPRYGELLCPVYGCVPEGPVGEGEACTPPPVGSIQGDDCQTGLICASGVCRDICSFDGSDSGLCQAGHNCTRHDDLFVLMPGSEPQFGSCEPIQGEARHRLGRSAAKLEG